MVSSANTQNDEQAAGFRVGLGRRLRTLREDAGKSQHDVELVTGISQSALSGYEGGRFAIPLEAALRLAACYGCPIDEIVDGAPLDGAGPTTIAGEA